MEQILLGVALVDHPAHPLGGGLRRDGESALAHALDLRGQALGHGLRPQAGQGDADVLRTELVEEVLEDPVDAGVVARAEREEAHFLVTGRLEALLSDAPHLVGIPLARRARDHPHLAEAASAGATPLDLERQAIVHGLHEGHDRLLGLRHQVQVGDDAADDALVAGLERLVARDGAVGGVVHAEERRHVHAGDLGQHPEQIFARGSAVPPGRDRVADLVHHLLALADDEGVEEVGDGLGVVGAGAAAEHQRILAPAVLRVQGDASEVQHRQHGGVAELELEGEPEDVEGRERRAALDREER